MAIPDGEILAVRFFTVLSVAPTSMVQSVKSLRG